MRIIFSFVALSLLSAFVVQVCGQQPSFAPVEESTAIHVVNATRRRIGLYPLTEDPELTRQAEIRLQDNVRRGRFDHNIVNGQWVRPLPPGVTEGCGNTFSTNRWFTCDMKTRRHKSAGAAMARMPNGRVWQMLLLK